MDLSLWNDVSCCGVRPSTAQWRGLGVVFGEKIAVKRGISFSTSCAADLHGNSLVSESGPLIRAACRPFLLRGSQREKG
ncbi:hypothetical protein CCHOA_00795 [Corynebacterium choanae]|uniref:Uncharacterized protein n=1 Tax=Corynebacterium choanae TaxID=1862358 RepID=A0A3G6J6P1_9CORY|nr:hypothetical protein CCHOA_00795 [Corynebacterium choanae]